MNKLSRRNLQFSEFNDVIADIRSLQASGYDRMGNWTLGQICDHLAIFFRGAIDGFGTKFPWIIRVTIGKYVLRQIFATGRMRTGVKVPRKFLPGNPREDAAAVEELFGLIERFAAKPEPFGPSPLFGRLSKNDWTRLHLIHCAHHLSFLVPRE